MQALSPLTPATPGPSAPPTPGASTPRRLPSYIRFPPRRAMTSFDNLVALANHQERLREARKIIWRDRGEPAVELHDLWECIEHAGRGGLRASALAFTLRASVNVVLALIRIKRVPRKLRFSLIYNAIFGPESVRFAAMLGSFVSLYKVILNALPLLMAAPTIPTRSANPSYALTPFADDDDDLAGGVLVSPVLASSKPLPAPPREARLSLSAAAHQRWIRKRTRSWHAVLAGAVAGGVGIVCETKARRTVIAQQLFVRGLQGTYNHFSDRWNFQVPYGDVIIFALACGQIMYGFTLHPDTLPRSYNTWIGQASKVHPAGVRINHDLVRTGTFNISDVEEILALDAVAPRNRTALLSLLSAPSTAPPYGPCEAVHPRIYSCTAVPFDRFLDVARWMLPIYGALHAIPMLLFRWQLVRENPARMALRALKGTLRSSAFLGTFVVIYQSFFCFKHWLHALLTAPSARTRLPPWVAALLVSKPSFWLGGALAGFSLFVEERRRRGELAMYVLPKGLESAWLMARGRGLVARTGEWGEVLLTAISMGMVMSIYQNEPQHLSGFVRRILYQFIGPN